MTKTIFTERKPIQVKKILVSAMSILLLAVLPFMAAPAKPAMSNPDDELFVTGFTKYTSNPVVNVGSSGAFDSNGAGTASVIKESSTSYKMWYTGVDINSVLTIGYATSTDGITWTKYGTTPVMTVGAVGQWDVTSVADPSVIYDATAALYKMWYTGTGADYIPKIGYATSADGITWNKSGSNPILSQQGAGFEATGVLAPSVVRENATSYKMWYSGRSVNTGAAVGVLKIGYATSADGITWTRSGSNPVLSPSASGWDSRGTGVASVVKTTVNSVTQYIMFYTGYANGGAGMTTQIGGAGSPDGVTWVKFGGSGNPVIAVGAATTWESNATGAPFVLRDGNDYKMWYTGVPDTLNPKIGYATTSPATYGFNIPVSAGWNIVSTPISLASSSNTWGSITTRGSWTLDYSIAYRFNSASQAWEQVTDSYAVTPMEGIYLKMNSADNLGLRANSGNTSPPTRTLSAGWNLVGPAEWPMSATRAVDQTLTSVYSTPAGLVGYDQVVSPGLNQTAWVYIRGAGGPPNVTMGKGFWVYMENGDTLAGLSTTPLQ